MKKNLFIYLATITLAIVGVFTACNKDLQNTTTKKAAINPLKDVPEGTTYTFYGQTEQNLTNEEVCQMQLTLGKDGEWTVKREIIPNRMLKSSVDITNVMVVNIPQKYISYPDESSIQFDFPKDEDVKYYFIPFEQNNKKIAGGETTTEKWTCLCFNSKTMTAVSGGCIKSDIPSSLYSGSPITCTSRSWGGKCPPDKSLSYYLGDVTDYGCTPIKEKITTSTSTSTTTPTPDRIISVSNDGLYSYTPGVLLPATNVSFASGK